MKEEGFKAYGGRITAARHAKKVFHLRKGNKARGSLGEVSKKIRKGGEREEVTGKGVPASFPKNQIGLGRIGQKDEK